MALGTLSQEYSVPNFQKILEEQLRKQFGRDVKIQWVGDMKMPEIPRSPSPSTPATPSPSAAPSSSATTEEAAARAQGARSGTMEHGTDETGAFQLTRDRKGRLRKFTRITRMDEILNTPVEVSKLWFFDPQCDVPLEPFLEEAMEEQIEEEGFEAYFHSLCTRHNVNFQPWPTTPHEVVRASRKLIRGLDEYDGERFIQ